MATSVKRNRELTGLRTRLCSVHDVRHPVMTRSFTVALVTLMILGWCLAAGEVRAETCIVKDGAAQATIVVAATPPRMAALAALELQYYVRKMSGATLPIAREPRAGSVSLFVGRSRFTDERGISDEKLPYGAFRMASGRDWLALVGHDRDALPPEAFRKALALPGAQERADKTRAIWDEMTANATTGKWEGPPVDALLWNPGGHFEEIMSRRYGVEAVPLLLAGRTPDFPAVGFSRWDAGGSLNAVCRYLMSLGVRWYMPGDLGEVVPECKTIPLQTLDATVHPDFALRTFNWSAYHTQPFDTIMWARRIGMSSAAEVWPFSWSHNLTRVYSRPEMRAVHPEFFAMHGGARDTDQPGKRAEACYSSEGLAKETVAYARFVFDHFDMPTVDLWPEDGYRGCECELCKGKSASELVWRFVDRVARELHSTHPDRLVTCAAYTPYTQPPADITFTPNVGVIIASGAMRPQFDRPEHLGSFLAYVRSWEKHVKPGNILRWVNSFWNSPPDLKFPVVDVRAIAAEIGALRGISKGEFHNWQTKPVFHNPGNSHLPLYATAQYLWDADQDVDALLEEYYARFYGPARAEMKAALEYAQGIYPREGRWPSSVGPAVQARFVELLHEARTRAGDTIYGRRIGLMIDELPPLDELRRLAREEAEAGDPRKNAPLLLGRDERISNYAGLGHAGGSETYGMRDLVQGVYPEIGTTFSVRWEDNKLCFDVRCAEPDMARLALTKSVSDGDGVVLLLETPVFSYYHIEVSPDGRVFERAVKPGPGMEGWSAQANVTTERDDTSWTVRVRLPVTGPDGLVTDAKHGLAGSKPGGAAPWYANVGRRRVRDGKVKQYAFVPTSRDTMHVPGSFAFLMFGNPPARFR